MGGLLEPYIGYQAVGSIFLLGVLAVGAMAPMGPTLIFALVSSIVWNYFFIPPRFTFHITAPQDFMMVLAHLIVGLTTGYLTNRIRFQERLMRQREERTQTLYDVLQDISSSRDKKEFLDKITARLGSLLNGEVRVLLRGADGKLQLEKKQSYGITLSDKEQAVAVWSFGAGKVAGWSTDTLAESKCLYIPLMSPSETMGVLVYKPGSKGKKLLDLEQGNLLHSVARQLAIALERHFFEKRIQVARNLEESEQLHQTLLNSISHEMRTPLTTIMGSATSLETEEAANNPAYVKALASELVEASDRLNQVIENLLDMSRLNSGRLALKRDWHMVEDLLGVVLAKMSKPLRNHVLVVEVEENLPLLSLDYRFMEHALSNLLLNAVSYSPAQSKIILTAKKVNSEVEITIEDEGPGVPEEYLERIFDKFFRAPGTPTGGVGLGLSIVKSIVDAHQGAIWVENRPENGAKFVVTIPVVLAPANYKKRNDHE